MGLEDKVNYLNQNLSTHLRKKIRCTKSTNKTIHAFNNTSRQDTTNIKLLENWEVPNCNKASSSPGRLDAESGRGKASENLIKTKKDWKIETNDGQNKTLKENVRHEVPKH